MKLKIFTFEDTLFCYRAICITKNKQEAEKIFKERAYWKGGQLIEEIEIKDGLFLEGGGNG